MNTRIAGDTVSPQPHLVIAATDTFADEYRTVPRGCD